MKKKIIVIDNDKDTLEIMAYILQEEGYEVISSIDSTPLINLIAHDPALIILDHWLDKEFGDELCLKLKSFPVTAHIPIILVSAINGLAEKSILCKADGFLEKPFDIAEFKAMVEKFVEAHLNYRDEQFKLLE